MRRLTSFSFVLQYYEMSYGLNIEMHKQVTAAGAPSSSAALPPSAQICPHLLRPPDCGLFSPQAEIVKRLNGICTQVLPYLSQEVTTLLQPERGCFLFTIVAFVCVCVCVTVSLPLFQHQQQVMGAIERAKQVTPPEMNSIIRVSLQCTDALGILA